MMASLMVDVTCGLGLPLSAVAGAFPAGKGECGHTRYCLDTRLPYAPGWPYWRKYGVRLAGAECKPF